MKKFSRIGVLKYISGSWLTLVILIGIFLGGLILTASGHISKYLVVKIIFTTIGFISVLYSAYFLVKDFFLIFFSNKIYISYLSIYSYYIENKLIQLDKDIDAISRRIKSANKLAEISRNEVLDIESELKKILVEVETYSRPDIKAKITRKLETQDLYELIGEIENNIKEIVSNLKEKALKLNQLAGAHSDKNIVLLRIIKKSEEMLENFVNKINTKEGELDFLDNFIYKLRQISE